MFVPPSTPPVSFARKRTKTVLLTWNRQTPDVRDVTSKLPALLLCTLLHQICVLVVGEYNKGD